jgi:hypothetical protein
MAITMTMTTTTTTDARVDRFAKPQADGEPAASGRFSVAHLFGFLIGRRESILVAARDRATPLVGLLFVCAAALAREYDGEDLRRQPWHLLIPLGASLALSFLLFVIIRRWRDTRRTFWSEYRSFLGLFWLTAPLALLYGIPYERFLSPLGAVQANLWTLAVVAAWRVALMTRVVAVFTGRSTTASFFLVMLLADAVAIAALFSVPVPTLQVMGGIRLTEAESLLQSTAFLAGAGAFLSSIVWVVGALIAWATPIERVPDIGASTARAPRGLVALAVGAIAIWLVFLPSTQREQRLRSDAERMLRGGEIARALAFMSQHDRDAFPPAWDPPPRIGWPEPERPAVMDVMKVLAAEPTAPWVREVYIDKFERRWLGWGIRSEENFREVLALLHELPEGPALLKKHAEFLGWVADAYDNRATTTQATTRPGAP